MWKDIVTLFRSEGPLQEAFDDSVTMLRASHGMYKDAVAALRGVGPMVVDIYERDRVLNKHERSVRRKIVTHMSVSSKPDINLGLVLTAIVIDIERIGDYTKNIVELSAGLESPFDALELNDDVSKIERSIDAMFTDAIPALEESDETLARRIMETHAEVAKIVDSTIPRLQDSQVLKGRSGHAVTVALYMRYLKRVSAHIKNVASSVVNPYHRIGFREKPSE
ncbi:MAG TPA: PhoU domain-containing protein [Longimicrobiales bacterium]|nr:PhoU domain-containing protein [Longimicrobiales bacterium]